MPLVAMSEMLLKAKAERYAVGQYNINGLEFAQSFLQAANENTAKTHSMFRIFIF